MHAPTGGKWVSIEMHACMSIEFSKHYHDVSMHIMYLCQFRWQTHPLIRYSPARRSSEEILFSSINSLNSPDTYMCRKEVHTLLHTIHGQAIPTLCYYVACLGQEGLAHSTIKTYLSGMRQVQIAHGFPAKQELY